MRIIDPKEAIAGIVRGATVAISGAGYRVVPETLLRHLGERFQREGSPSGLTVITVSMIERTRGGRGGEGTGLNRLAHDGLIDRLISSSFSRAPEREINQLIRNNRLAAYNLPMGTIVQWLRAIGAGRRGLATTVGIGTFVDPRIEAGRANERAEEPLSRLIEVAGEEHIYYPAMTIDVALIKASAADERGNLYLDRTPFDHGLLDVVLAARNSGGTVIAEVDRIVSRGDLPARLARVPGAMVDAVVVREDEPWEDEQDPVLLGFTRMALPDPVDANRPRDLIAKLAVSLLPAGAMVNLGAGIPMYDVPEAARLGGRDDLYFTVEQGPMGGWPQVGGVARNPEAILEQQEVFDFYEGGGPDVSVLSFGQVDRHGNVNVSKFGRMMTGCGGFTNIAHGIRNLFFCGTLTTGGLVEEVEDERLVIHQEGLIDRFVTDVEQITFSAPHALRKGHRLTYITDRAVLEADGDGLRIIALTAGVDLQKNVLDHIPFPVTVDRDLVKIAPRELRNKEYSMRNTRPGGRGTAPMTIGGLS